MNARADVTALSDDSRFAKRTLAEGLVDQWFQFPIDDIPEFVFDRVARCIEDTVGVALAAVGLGVGVAAASVAVKTAPGPATIWGFAKDVSAGEAAFANGMLAHALDFDDTHTAAIMHSSCMIVPTAIAVGQAVGASSKEILAAAAIGYEVAARLGRLAPGPFQDNGFQATSVLGVFASTMVACRLMGLSDKQCVHALGIAGSMSAGLMEYLSDGTDVKQMHAGWAAQSGIRAAELAAVGFTGPASVFEGKSGVFRSFIRKDINPLDALQWDGAHWEVADMGPKPYPACLCVHPLVQAVLDLRHRGILDADSQDGVSGIHCYVPRWYVGLVFEPIADKRQVRTLYEAKFSAPFCMARALLDGELTITSFSLEKLSDRRVEAISSKITYSVEDLPEFPASFPAKVVVKGQGGVIGESYIHHNLGAVGNPFTDEQYEEKFFSTAAPAIGDRQARELHQSIRSLPKPGSVLHFYECLRTYPVQSVVI